MSLVELLKWLTFCFLFIIPFLSLLSVLKYTKNVVVFWVYWKRHTLHNNSWTWIPEQNMPRNLRMRCVVHRNSLNSKETQQTRAICNKSSVKFFQEKQALCKCGRSCEEAHATKFLFAKWKFEDFIRLIDLLLKGSLDLRINCRTLKKIGFKNSQNSAYAR